jgi:hypothetical protein
MALLEAPPAMKINILPSLPMIVEYLELNKMVNIIYCHMVPKVTTLHPRLYWNPRALQMSNQKAPNSQKQKRNTFLKLTRQYSFSRKAACPCKIMCLKLLKLPAKD